MRFSTTSRFSGHSSKEAKVEPQWWRTTDTAPVNDVLFGGKDWNDLAVLMDDESLMGRAVRTAQRYFTDEEIGEAMNGNSRDVSLRIIDAVPVFVNAAMLSEIMMGIEVDALAA